MSSLAGKCVVFTGTLAMKREDAKAAAELAGAKVGSGVTGKTDILIAGPGAGAKEVQARAKGIDIWSEQQFAAAVAGGVGINSSSGAGGKAAGKKSKKRAEPYPAALMQDVKERKRQTILQRIRAEGQGTGARIFRETKHEFHGDEEVAIAALEAGYSDDDDLESTVDALGPKLVGSKKIVMKLVGEHAGKFFDSEDKYTDSIKMWKFHRWLGPLRADKEFLKEVVKEGGLRFLPVDMRSDPEFLAVAQATDPELPVVMQPAPAGAIWLLSQGWEAGDVASWLQEQCGWPCDQCAGWLLAKGLEPGGVASWLQDEGARP